MVVSSAFVSYAGATSTRSAPTRCRPSSPRTISRSSRVDQPPVSGVPVAGANAGSIVSICGAGASVRAGRRRRLSEGAHIDGHVHGVGPDSVADLFDDAGDAEGVNLARLDAVESGAVVVVVVGGAGERRADGAVLEAGKAREHTLSRAHTHMEKIRAMELPLRMRPSWAAQ